MVLQYVVSKETGDVLGVDDREGAKGTKPATLETEPADPETGTKYDTEKPDYALLDFQVLEEVVQVLTFGKSKYGAHNWRKVKGWHWRYLSALFRHAAAWARGEKVDPETGISHLAHVIVNALFLRSKEIENHGA